MRMVWKIKWEPEKDYMLRTLHRYKGHLPTPEEEFFMLMILYGGENELEKI